MPDINGYEFIYQIRALPQVSHIPAIALTAFAQPKDQIEVIEAGFQTYFAKPVNPAQLLVAVTNLLMT
jgi:CheY-like chemotaxis protein